MPRPGMNYELIYKCRPVQEAVWAKQRAITKAKADAEDAERIYREHVAKVSGVPLKDLRFTTGFCPADGIGGHAFFMKRPDAPHGHADNKCVFCGNDDYDDPLI